MPPPRRPGDPAVVSRPMHTTEGGAAAGASEPADTPDDRPDDAARHHRDRRPSGSSPCSPERCCGSRRRRRCGSTRRSASTSPSCPPATSCAGCATTATRRSTTCSCTSGPTSSAPVTSPSGPCPGCSACSPCRSPGSPAVAAAAPLLGWVAGHVRGAVALRGAVLRRGPHVLDGDVPGLRRVPAARRRAASRQRRRCCASSGSRVVAAALLYTHYWAIWLLAAAGLIVLWQAFRGAPTPPPGGRRGRPPGRWSSAGCSSCPWLPVDALPVGPHRHPVGEPDAPDGRRRLHLQRLRLRSLRRRRASSPSCSASSSLLGLFGRGRDAAHIDLDLRTRPQLRVEALVAALTFAIGIVMSYAAKGAFATRYAAVIFPFVALLVAGGVTRFAARWVRFGALLRALRLPRRRRPLERRRHPHPGRPGRRRHQRQRPARRPRHLLPRPARPRRQPCRHRRRAADRLPDLRRPAARRLGRLQGAPGRHRPGGRSPSGRSTSRPSDRAIFVVWNTEYKTFEGDCEALLGAIGAERPGQELVAGQRQVLREGVGDVVPRHLVSRR